jgi:hypothetical protein
MAAGSLIGAESSTGDPLTQRYVTSLWFPGTIFYRARTKAAVDGFRGLFNCVIFTQHLTEKGERSL